MAELPPDVPTFDYVTADGAPLDTFDDDAYPYLPLVAHQLAQAHQTCTGTLGDATIYGFLRCEAGWDWAVTDVGGYACLDLTPPDWTYLALADTATCIPNPSPDGALVGAPVDGASLGPLASCPDGVQVPIQGLLLERTDHRSFNNAGCP